MTEIQKNQFNLSNKRELSNIEIDKWCYANIVGYKGCYSRTDIEKIFDEMKPGNSFIINLDPHYKHGGTHWTALRLSSEAPLVLYRDSFGFPPPQEVVNIIKKHKLGLLYSDDMLQKKNEKNCGWHSAQFLKHMDEAASKDLELETFSENY